VPQGSVLGPVLYNIYTSDMPLPGYSNATDGMLLATYADDTVIMSAHVAPTIAFNRMDSYLKRFEKWTTKWCITVNTAKTVHVLHSLRTCTMTRSPCYAGTALQNETSHTYLGVKLDAKLNLNSHVSQLVIKVRRREQKLRWLYGRNSKLPLKTRIIIYKQLIAPVWQYTIAVWGPLTSQGSFNKIYVLQNRALREITGCPYYVRNQTLYTDLRMKTVDEIYDNICDNYAQRLLNHPNIEARKLALYPYVPVRLSRPRYLQMIDRCLPLHMRPPMPQSPQTEAAERPMLNVRPFNFRDQLLLAPVYRGWHPATPPAVSHRIVIPVNPLHVRVPTADVSGTPANQNAQLVNMQANNTNIRDSTEIVSAILSITNNPVFQATSNVNSLLSPHAALPSANQPETEHTDCCINNTRLGAELYSQNSPTNQATESTQPGTEEINLPQDTPGFATSDDFEILIAQQQIESANAHSVSHS